MAKFISFGKCLPSYLYIVFVIIFNVLKDISFGSHEVEYYRNLKMFDSGPLNNCYFIHQIFCYLVTFIVGLVLYNKESQIINRNSIEYSFKKLENKMTENQTLDIELVHSEQEIKDYPDIFLFIIILIWVLNEESLDYFNGIFIHLDFWMIELIILTFFMRYLLNLKIYRHQIATLGLCLVPFILKLGTIIISINDDGNKGDDKNFQYRSVTEKLKIIYIAKPKLSLFIILYIVLLVVKCYINTKIKWLIDLRYISWKKIFTIYGLIGTIFCTVVSLIATFNSCDKGEHVSIVGQKDIIDYFCKVQYGNKRYLESFKTYFSSNSISNIQIVMEFLTVIIGVGAFIGYKISFLYTLEHLTPVHLIFAIPAYYLINKPYLFILNICKTSDHSAYIKIDDGENPNFEIKIAMDFCSDIFSVFGYLVYLEVIELNCCTLDHNLRRKILARGIIDVYKADPNNTYNSGSDGGRNNSEGQISNSSLNDSYF